MTPRRASRLGGRFWRVWAAQGISSVGDGVRAAALPLLAAGITHRPLAVASVTVAEGLPWVLFALIAGALVDRLDRRKVMGIADLCRFVTVGLLAVAVATDHASIPLLCLAGFALGTAQTMFDNASQAILPAVVDQPQLERANSRLATIQILSESFVGPPLGAALFVGLAAVPFFVDSASFLIAALIVLTLAGSYRAPRVGPPRHLHTEIAEGLRWLWHHRLIRTLALMLTVWNMVAAAIAAVFVLFALRTLHLSKVEYGVLLTSAAIGGLIGSFVATRVVARLGPGRAAPMRRAGRGRLVPRHVPLPPGRRHRHPHRRRGDGRHRLERRHRLGSPDDHPDRALRPGQQRLPLPGLGQHPDRRRHRRRAGHRVRAPRTVRAGRDRARRS